MRLKVIGIFLLLFIVGLNALKAQIDDCEQSITTASEEFSAGRFSGISAILKPCIENGFTIDQRQRAFLLLAETYLLLDDPIAAEDSYLKLLKSNPEFVADETRDAIDLVYLSKKFTSAPIFSLYAQLGPNISPVRVIDKISLTADNVARSKYMMSPGFQVIVGSDLHFNENFSITAGLQYMYSAYKHTRSNMFNLYATGNARDKVEIFDKQNWVNVPLSIKYNYLQSKFKPFIYVGYSLNFLLSDKAIIKYTDSNFSATEGSVSREYTSPNTDLRYKRKLFTQSLFIGGGLKRKIGLNYIFADLRYSFGMRNLVKPTNLYANYEKSDAYTTSLDLPFKYNYVDDYFRLDNLSISIGYIYPLYKPRKLKRAATKSIMKKIRKQK